MIIVEVCCPKYCNAMMHDFLYNDRTMLRIIKTVHAYRMISADQSIPILSMYSDIVVTAARKHYKLYVGISSTSGLV